MYGYLLDIKIAANSPFFWHRLGIVASFVASFVVCGIVIQPTASHQERQQQEGHQRQPKPPASDQYEAARTNDDNQLFIDGKENGVPMVTAYIEPINQTEWKIQP